MDPTASMNIFLKQEIDRMQIIIKLVRVTLKDLLLAIEGVIIMNEVCFCSISFKKIVIKGGSQTLDRLIVQRPIFRNFKIANIKHQKKSYANFLFSNLLFFNLIIIYLST